jgi:hypothetical protein
MIASQATSQLSGRAFIFSWRRVRVVLGICTLFGLLLSINNESPTLVVIARTMLVGVGALLGFGLFERWPRRLPRWLARSVLQLVAIVVSIPISVVIGYALTTGGDPQFDQNEKRATGAGMLMVTGLLFAPWIAVGAMLKQRDAFAREQAFAFELERSRLERNALDAKLRLLQAQIEPHFLFNTLANIQALVDTGSPQASRVLTSLIAYLRAAVPRMHEPASVLGQEIDLVRAYLELMQMRMPDRLDVAIHIEPAARSISCPAMTVLTLVENAVRHGIDPSEIGGRIDVDVWLRDGRCIIRVVDTGVGLQVAGGGLGTGLSTLRERLQLTFGEEASLQLTEVQPHGVCAELNIPARQTA